MYTVVNYLRLTHDLITRTIYAIGVLCLLFILFGFLVEIISRYVFKAPTFWVLDFTSYALLISTMFIVPQLTKDMKHIQISFLQENILGVKKVVLNCMIFLVSSVVCFWASMYAAEEAMRQYQRGVNTMAVVTVPKWWMSAIIAYAFSNSGVYFARHFVTSCKPMTHVQKSLKGEIK